uniref:A-kinase anchor protein 13 isoform X6 n=1 Tax=Castor canadensis TaxID=51338 RepID=A0A8B7WF41_CASCN|nr:A-kinase anchor protein 13 isoform X6 [Castor canadensis]
MKLTPQQAPLYGDCVVTVLLAEEDKVEDDVVFYLVFSGSTLHHYTSTRKVSSDTLETIAPGHNCCETVKVLLCASKEGVPVFVVAEEDFHFVQDEAYDAAQFLATSAGNQQALNFTRFLDRSGPPSADVNSLDEKVALAFRHLKLPAEWNVLGADHTSHDGGPRETLMHFAVRLGLLRLTWFLLQKPGGRGALSIHNQEGATPVSLALERGYHKLHQLLTEENAGEPDSWSSLSYEIPYGDYSVRHHRELDVYTLTSESESHHKPSFPGDSCTGHIFKLMNIQQQLMKTNIKQMDSLAPLMVTVQDPFSLPSAPETEGQFIPCASEPLDSQQLSFPSEETQSTLCCQGSRVGQVESSRDLLSVVEEEHTDCCHRTKTKGMERKEKEVEPAPVVDSGTVSDQDSCLQSKPDCGGKGTGGLLSSGNRNEETGTKSSGMATEQESVTSGASVLQGDMVTKPDTSQHSFGGELAGSSTTHASASERARESEHSLMNSAATTQNNMLQVGESIKERFENSKFDTVVASGIQVISEPVDKANVPNCFSATRALGTKPPESSFTLSPGETLTEKTSGVETPRRNCEERADTVGHQNSLVIPAAEDRISFGSEPDTPLASLCEARSPSDLTFSDLKRDVMPNQKSETNSSSVQRKLPVCSTIGDEKPCAEFACQQNTVTSSGNLVAKHGTDVASQGESTSGHLNRQDPCIAVCSKDPQVDAVTSDPVRDAQQYVDVCPLEVLDKNVQGKDLKLDTLLINTLEVVSHLPPVVPQTEKELVPDRAVPSDSTFSRANSPGSESVTKDDVLSLVPSQKEKGTASPELHRAKACRDGSVSRDSNDPIEQPLEDRAVGLSASSAVVELPPSMGNTSPTGLSGEHESPGHSAAADVTTDSSLLYMDKATLASDSILTEEGNNLVGSKSSAAQGQDDKDKVGTCSSIKEDTFSSGTACKEQGIPPPGQETPGFCEKPLPAACDEDKELQHSSSQGTPSAGLNTETRHNKGEAQQASLLTEGGAALSLVPPGASLPADSRQEALGAEHNSSSPLPGLRPNESKALNCNQPFALDLKLKNIQLWEGSSACEVSRNVPVDVAVVNTLQGNTGPRRKDISHSTADVLISEASLSQEKNMTLSLPGALPDKGATVLQGVVAPEVVLLNCNTGKLEEADHSCTMGDSKEAQMDDEAPQPLAKEFPTPRVLSALDDAAQAGVRQGSQASAPGEDSSTPSLPYLVSAQAVHVPKGTDSIEEAASRIVEAVIERVKASGALTTEGEMRHVLSSSPRLGPQMEQQVNASADGVSALPPEDTLQMDGTHEGTTQNLEGCFVGKEETEKIFLPVQGPEPAIEMPDTKAEDEVDFLNKISSSSGSEELAVENGAGVPQMKQGPKTQVINRESWCTIEPGPDEASLLASKQSPDCENFLDVELGRACASKQRDSGSDPDLFHSPSSVTDSIISKPEEEQLVCDITGSSSADDTASLDQHSSHGNNMSIPQISKLSKSRDHQSPDGMYSLGVGTEDGESESEPVGCGEIEEEEMDSITEVPASCSVLRSSMRSLSPFRRHSWGPGKNAASDAEMNQRSFSLEGLTGGAGIGNKLSSSLEVNSANSKELMHPFSGEEQGDSLVSLSEENLDSDQREHRMFDQQTCHRSKHQRFNYCTSAISSPLTKSISLMTISNPGLDTQPQMQPARRISFSISISPLLLKSKTLFSLGSSYSSDEDEELHNSRPFHNTSANLTESITEENYNFPPQSPSKKDFEGKSGTKVSRTFSYIRNKMSSSKKSKEKEKEKDKIKEKEKDSKEKEKDKKTLNGHNFSSIPVVGPITCSQCMKPFTNKDAYTCANCSAFVHKGCRENVASCAKVKMKPKGSLQAHDTSSLPTVIMRSKPSQPKERPRSAVLLADEATAAPMFVNRRSQQSVSLSKSVSIQNITGVGSDENMSNTWKFLSHSTDSLNKICKVNESTESLTDEGVGTDMNEGQLMGDFETDCKQLEAESWSRIVDSKFLKQQKKDVVKRQEVIYELMQTEFHHIRTLKVMSDVYSRGMTTELLFEQQMVEKLFPCVDELISIHSQFFQRILERKKESLLDKSEKNFLIKRIGDVLVNQFSGENAERLKKTYGKFCGQHNQSVNYFKDLYTKDKRFQAFVKKKMSSSVVRRLGIPECILLVTQRITKYPVLFQRILQCTKDNDVEQEDLAQSLSLVKDVIGAVDSKVASYEKKVRLSEIYTKTDSKSIMRMKSGQMFAKEDLKRKKLVRDGSVFLKSVTGRLKEVQAVLLTDILVFLQEKDQKYIFASLDQKSTVISLKKLIVREVAHEEKGLFLISMGVRDPEMVEVHASSREERNSWIQIIQDTINTLNRDEDEGIPSENEEEKKMLDTKARELKEQLQQKDQQILLLLEEKEMIFRDLTECSTPLPEDCSPTHSPRTLFRSNTVEALKGGPLMKSAINEVEILQGLVSGNLGGILGQAISSPVEQEVTAGPVSLPRRAETFGGFDSHQMNASKAGEKEEGDDGQDLRRTESDSGLKKGGNANLVFMLKRNSEQVVQSIVHLHELLSTLQGVVLQQDSYIEDQKLVLTERALTRSSSRPSSLIEQEKQRSLEKQRQDLANLQKQQAQHLEEKRRREREWETRERELQEREAQLVEREEKVQRGQQDLERDREELQQKKGTYQCDLERLRAAQRQLEREQEQLRQRQMERDFCQVSHQHTKLMRVPSFFPNPEASSLPSAPSVTKSGSLDSELSVSPKRNSISRTHKDKGPFHILSSTSQPNRVPEGPGQAPSTTSTRLFGLTKPKEKKEKKKKSKGSRSQPGEGPASEVSAESEEIFC